MPLAGCYFLQDAISCRMLVSAAGDYYILDAYLTPHHEGAHLSRV